MKNILIFTHGDFSKGIAHSLSFILGDVSNVKTMSITLDQSIEDIRETLEQTVCSFENQYPTIILTDIPGGSTTQCAMNYLSMHENVYVVSGLNLGLLMELSFLRLDENVESNKAKIREIVMHARETISLLNDSMTDADEELLIDDGEL
ncbi:MAG: hypothetical protein Q4C49_01640 [Bacillota bacterium]|nr:hypothetical protein [Bacillota bacterium]